MVSYKKIGISFFVMLFAVSMITSLSLQNNAYAADQGLSVVATASDGSDEINLSGYTGSGSGIPVTLTVVAPNGNVVAIDQISPGSDGKFSTDIGVGALWLSLIHI